jgi:predicted RNase H-like nuclease (RuvC/YqgF family)
VESFEGISDRQILIEAAQHIEELNEQDQQLEESIAQLKVENLALQVDQARARISQRKNSLAAIADAAALASLESELGDAKAMLKMLLERPRIVRTLDEDGNRDDVTDPGTHRPRPNSTSSESTGNTAQHGMPGGDIFHLSMHESPDHKPAPPFKSEQDGLLLTALDV